MTPSRHLLREIMARRRGAVQGISCRCAGALHSMAAPWAEGRRYAPPHNGGLRKQEKFQLVSRPWSRVPSRLGPLPPASGAAAPQQFQGSNERIQGSNERSVASQ